MPEEKRTEEQAELNQMDQFIEAVNRKLDEFYSKEVDSSERQQNGVFKDDYIQTWAVVKTRVAMANALLKIIEGCHRDSPDLAVHLMDMVKNVEAGIWSACVDYTKQIKDYELFMLNKRAEKVFAGSESAVADNPFANDPDDDDDDDDDDAARAEVAHEQSILARKSRSSGDFE